MKKRAVIAFLGAGTMAKGMIKNLQKNGFSLRLNNRTINRAKSLARKNDLVCSSPSEAAKNADVIISSLLDDDSCNEVWFGDNGATKTARPGSICIETSTVSVTHIDKWSKNIKNIGLHPIDCPITGSKLGAKNATLTLFLGGKKADIHEVRDILESISRQQYYLGSSGSGIRFKITYNMLGGTILVALCEAVGLAQKLGLNMKQVITILAENRQGWSAAAAQSKGKQIINKSYVDVACSLDIMSKDLRYAMKSASLMNQPVPTSKQALLMLKKAQKQKLGKLDMSAVGNLFIK